MIKVLMAAVVVMSFVTAAQAATSKAEDCKIQGQVVAAIQQARLDRVRENKVQAHVEAAGDWPARYNNSIPIFAGWIYSRDVKMRDLRNQNFGEAWRETCMSQ